MVDIEEFKKRQARDLKEVELANAYEMKFGIRPNVFWFRGKMRVYFKGDNVDDKFAGLVLSECPSTGTRQTPKKRDTWYICQTRYEAADDAPTLSVQWYAGSDEITIILDLTKSCVLGTWIHKHGQRQVASWEAENGIAVRKYGRVDYKMLVDRYAFNGEQSAYQGGSIVSDEPLICEGIVQALKDAYTKNDN